MSFLEFFFPSSAPFLHALHKAETFCRNPMVDLRRHQTHHPFQSSRSRNFSPSELTFLLQSSEMSCKLQGHVLTGQQGSHGGELVDMVSCALIETELDKPLLEKNQETKGRTITLIEKDNQNTMVLRELKSWNTQLAEAKSKRKQEKSDGPTFDGHFKIMSNDGQRLRREQISLKMPREMQRRSLRNDKLTRTIQSASLLSQSFGGTRYAPQWTVRKFQEQNETQSSLQISVSAVHHQARGQGGTCGCCWDTEAMPSVYDLIEKLYRDNVTAANWDGSHEIVSRASCSNREGSTEGKTAAFGVRF
ncbi:hypothetical protein PROFUN_01213 [Planoprotostelium fungivorum]|uniref:Uncharacterized protein n=1 Tax=Planoprotostelium fungivorum TaxID=1890364 RepID=A0A2P6NCL3_9EUKA|nr:hypothetical protein PROFUN_01213 [Planoprotostelium fungivorum]